MSSQSVIALWERYRLTNPQVALDPPPAEHFCDNEEGADNCASLIITGRKRATASALMEYELSGNPIPEPGKLVIVTDWFGEAKALIRTKRVTIYRFADVPASFAALEGEGDGSLAWWRDEHRSFWNRTATGTGGVQDDLAVVCEEFEVLLIA